MQVFEVLADPTRREIVEMLASGERTAGQIADHFPVSGPAISRHLRVLRESGVCTYSQAGQRRVYRLRPEALREANDWLVERLQLWQARSDALASHLDVMAGEEVADDR